MATKIKGGNISVPAIDELENNLEARISKPGNVKIRRAITNLVDSDYVGARSAGGGADSASVIGIVDSRFKFNPNSVSSNVTVDSNENAMVVGPIDVDSGVTITINGTFMVF
jgi:hypothetical protein